MDYSTFCRIDSPPYSSVTPAVSCATWLTWSPSFRAFLGQVEPDLRKLGAPPLVEVPELTSYRKTFSFSHTDWTTPELCRHFVGFARSLCSFRPGEEIAFLHDMIGNGLSSGSLQTLFALLRGAWTELAGDSRAAMYAPVGGVGEIGRDFPLHADLFIPDHLLVVFDEVPDDDSGASLFLPVSALKALLPGVLSMPAWAAREIISIFQSEPGYDRFNTLHALLHGPFGWVAELEQKMQSHQIRIKLHRGQGYLLYDRAWLHGREAPKGGISAHRFHRLVYSSLNDPLGSRAT